MIAKISPDDKFHMTISTEHQDELYGLTKSFTKKIRLAAIKTKGKRWDGSVEFLKNYNKLPLGFWLHLQQTVCKKYNFPLRLEGMENIINTNVTEEHVTWFCMELMRGYKHSLRPYQIKAVYLAVKYNYCIFDLATAAGKTLIVYLYIAYMKYIGNKGKFLVICPDPSLVIQFYNDFMEYSMGKYDVKHCQIHGGSKIEDIEKYRIVIGNFQTLINRGEDWFKIFKHVICDEVHRAEADTIKSILNFSKNANSRVGLTGSLIIDESAEYYNLLAYFGPVVLTVTKKDLMDNNWATKININVITLNWASEEMRKKLCILQEAKAVGGSGSLDGSDIFEIEQNYIRESKARIYWLARFISQLSGNTLVFFIDKKHGYGRRMVEMLKTVSTGKEIYYIDGDISNDLRDAYKERMEEGDNKILVASYATYSTGKSINNLRNLVCIESMKSEVVIDQATGRGMRLHEDKDFFNWYDIVDDISIHTNGYNNENYMLKHMKDRCKFYVKEGFSYKSTDVDLRKLDQYKNMDQLPS